MEKLWTFQSEMRVRKLLCNGFLLGDWEQTIRSHANETAYRYMCSEMALCGLPCGDNPPIWTWHSCGGYQSPPDHEVARSLLSNFEMENYKIWLLSLECPTSSFLLSKYHTWCEYHYFPSLSECFFDPGLLIPSKEESKSSLFNVGFSELTSDSLIQATIPAVHKNHLVKVQRVILDNNGGVKII